MKERYPKHGCRIAFPNNAQIVSAFVYERDWNLTRRPGVGQTFMRCQATTIDCKVITKRCPREGCAIVGLPHLFQVEDSVGELIIRCHAYSLVVDAAIATRPVFILYERARLTISFVQFAAHVPDGDVVTNFRQLLALPFAPVYFRV